MAYYDIHKALTQSIIDLNLGLPIAHENVNFNPDNISGNMFIDLTTLFNDQVSLTKKELDEVTGVFQISVYKKSGLSIKSVLQTVDLITGFYKHNVTLTSGSQNVVIVNTGRNAGRNQDGWYVIDISVSFKSDILR